jgi:DNA-binding IclR family transcriptional regulator
MSVSVPTVRFTPQRQDELRKLVQENARHLSRILGYHQKAR